MRATDLAGLKALIDLLKAEGVRKFCKGALEVEFFAAEPRSDVTADVTVRRPEVPEKLRGLDSNYFHPALGVVEFK